MLIVEFLKWNIQIWIDSILVNNGLFEENEQTVPDQTALLQFQWNYNGVEAINTFYLRNN